MRFVFTNEQTLKRTDEIVEYLTGPRLWIAQDQYPDYSNWISKVHYQLKCESKRALIALSGGRVAGAIIYQRHLELHEALEIKNISVRPEVEGRLVASFLLRNTEIEGARDFGSRVALIDSKARNKPIYRFLMASGYHALNPADLYKLGAGEDILYTKSLTYQDP